jgi:hypothetical protein
MRIITKNTTTPGKIPEPSDLLVGELAVNTADGRIYTKHIDDSIVACGVDPYPEAPTILSPTGTGITLIPTLVTSAYVIAAADAHLYSRYQISTNSTFTNIVYDSGIIGTNLTTITINVKLEQNTDYYIRARHCASNGGWSFWGAAKHIVTTNVVIAQPTLTIQDAPNNIPLVPVLTGTPFESTGDADQFWAAD